MGARLRSRWQRVRKSLEVGGVIVGCILIIALIAVIVLGYLFNWPWVGVNDGYNKIPLEQPSSKTIWDWLQLLIIPIMLATGGYIFNATLSRNEQRSSQDDQQEGTLQSYLHGMSDLLLEKQLRTSQPNDEVRNVARAITLAALRKLNSERKLVLIRFLFESNLFNIIKLDDADLSGILLRNITLRDLEMHYAIVTNVFFDNFNFERCDFDDTNFSNSTYTGIKVISSSLRGVNFSHTKMTNLDFTGSSLIEADLSYANLSNVIFRNADLSNANFTGARLSNVDLHGATITREQLNRAKLLQGVSMDAGRIHTEGSAYSIEV
jgi:uncharacterized protein YjbI with pentapeptide repeats